MECLGDRQPVLQIDKFFRGLGKNKFGSLGFGLQKVAKLGQIELIQGICLRVRHRALKLA